MNVTERGRRRFLKEGAVLAGLAVGAVRSANGQIIGSETPAPPPAAQDGALYNERSPFETSLKGRWKGPARRSTRPAGSYLFTPLQDSVGIITPSALHFVNGAGHHDVDPRQHRLLIHGLVDRPLIFTLEDLKRLPSVSRIHFLECANNSAESAKFNAATVQFTHGRTSCSEWTGVLLSLLLNETGVQKGASWIVAEGAEPRKHSKSIPLEKAMDDVLIAYGQNGEALRPSQGYPLRLMVPGWEGINSVKWARRIKVVDQPYMAKSESTLYANLRLDGISRWFQFEMGPKSVITFPSGGQQLPGQGFFEIAGLAWSGGGAIRRVEVSTDGGQSWKDAEIQEPVHRKAHTRFRLSWTWNGKEAVLQSRCTDERGEVQPTLAELGKLWGVGSDYWRSTTNFYNHLIFIQSWRIDQEGKVHNALLA